jgi:predicted anti-sigma-YlaC factor YlaD
MVIMIHGMDILITDMVTITGMGMDTDITIIGMDTTTVITMGPMVIHMADTHLTTATGVPSVLQDIQEVQHVMTQKKQAKDHQKLVFQQVGEALQLITQEMEAI